MRERSPRTIHRRILSHHLRAFPYAAFVRVCVRFCIFAELFRFHAALPGHQPFNIHVKKFSDFKETVGTWLRPCQPAAYRGLRHANMLGQGTFRVS